MISASKRAVKSSGEKEKSKHLKTASHLYPPSYPSGVRIIAHRNRQKNFCQPRKDTAVCGIACERVMFDNGCNGILLPFLDEAKGFETLCPFNNDSHCWECAWSGGTGGIHCPTLKISPQLKGGIGVMKFDKDYESRMPFLRFHFGTAASRWLVANPHKLDAFNIAKLRRFLENMGEKIAHGRTIAIIRQMLLGRLCVVQAGTVMFMMDAGDASINPLRLSNDCVNATNRLVEDYGGFNDGNKLCDRDGVTP